MKTMQFSMLTLLLMSTLFLPNSFAQDYTQWRLPEGANARLGKGGVGDIAYSPDGHRLVVASSIGIWLYDAHSLVELDLFTGHTEAITSLSFSPDGKTIASSSYDETVRLWDAEGGQLKATLTGHTGRISSVAFSPDSSILAGGGTYGEYTVWLWDVASRELKATLVGHTRTITSVAFSPDGRTLASGAWDNTVRLWDIATGKQKAVLTEHTFFGEGTSGISNVAFSPDGQTLVSAAFNEEGVRFWDATTGQHKRILNTDKMSSLAFSPDGSTLATGASSELSLWDVASGERKAALTGHTWYINSLAFSPDGNTLVSGDGSRLLLWDSENGAQKGEITGHLPNGRRIAFAPDGSTLASTGRRHTVHLWDITNKQHKGALIGARVGDWLSSIAFSPDGRTLAGGSGWRIWLWDVTNGHLKTVMKAFTGNSASGGGISAVAFSPDGSFLASGSGHQDMKVQVWYDGRTHKVTFTGHTEAITSIAFHPDSRTLASGSQDGTVRLWDVINETHKMTLTGHTDWVNRVAFSPDGRTLASGSRDTTVRLWDAVTGARETTLTGHIDGVESVAFSPDSRTLASGGGRDDKTVRLWDVASGMHKATLIGHRNEVSSVAFSLDGRALASGSRDGTVLLWEILSATDEPPQLAEDVNRDGMVNLQDLSLVAEHFGQPVGVSSQSRYDVNADGVVNIIDLVLVAGALGAGDSAPSLHPRAASRPTAAEVQQWLTAAQQSNRTHPVFEKGIAVLEALLAALTPKETALLPNYPNPFNPETWMPYQLAESADVTVRIYTANGRLVRTLALGYQAAGSYHSRSRAAYWDGKNEIGEPVASGVYFYTLSTGEFTATRKMFIQK